MKISDKPCSKIKRYLRYNSNDELSGVIEIIKYGENKGLLVKNSSNLFLQENLEWSEKLCYFENEEIAMQKIKECPS